VLAEQVLQLLHNPQQRERFGVAARRRALFYDQRLTLAALTQLLERQASAASRMPVASR